MSDKCQLCKHNYNVTSQLSIYIKQNDSVISRYEKMFDNLCDHCVGHMLRASHLTMGR